MASTSKVLYHPQHFSPDDGVKTIEELHDVLQELGEPRGVEITSYHIHHQAKFDEIEMLPDSFWVRLANRKHIDGYIVYADYLAKSFQIARDPSLGALLLKRSFTLRQVPPPTFVVLFTEPIKAVEERYPEFIEALRGKAHLIQCADKDKSVYSLANEIVSCFIFPRPYPTSGLKEAERPKQINIWPLFDREDGPEGRYTSPWWYNYPNPAYLEALRSLSCVDICPGSEGVGYTMENESTEGRIRRKFVHVPWIHAITKSIVDPRIGSGNQVTGAIILSEALFKAVYLDEGFSSKYISHFSKELKLLSCDRRLVFLHGFLTSDAIRKIYPDFIELIEENGLFIPLGHTDPVIAARQTLEYILEGKR